ncbi:TPA: hypothetical protein MYK87_004878 [Klebsiella pneumoniae]|jgi:hypothetical protein|uniref:Uncharacterized protein n=3 Tax=Salmonella enterica subsp. arizonae TaxID=59203 RepID=A9MGR8_SALAR|nr:MULTISPECIES: hypothetical protein [Enterobacteriaceae]ABX20179.1 hypothetical protein SARI_00232 [Salmonella enterica subsp. arizonae serovar 62:z4,z23:-]ECC1554416.1 hypothetical protein [Salmonella enterica subsp. arizonae]ECK9495023.1 hypothetical protein [Salmonella enterica subsp. arizonae str. CFSAN000561]EDU6455392.1 hypothetical protein [Salmonella enterica subsp. arizonae serovar 41:z4,z32:-]EDW7125541.1 hypothetical protein [Salmonella enterica subsp. enterica serovar Waycross]E
MKNNDKIVSGSQARDPSKMQFKSNYQNMYTDEGIIVLDAAKERIKRRQKEINRSRQLADLD